MERLEEFLAGRRMARAVNYRILERHLTPAGIEAPGVGRTIAESDDVTLRLEPGEWRTWSTSED